MRNEKRSRKRKKVTPDSKPVLYTIQQFAVVMGISIATARRLAYAREMASTKIRGRLMVPVTEVERLIAARLRPASV